MVSASQRSLDQGAWSSMNQPLVATLFITLILMMTPPAAAQSPEESAPKEPDAQSLSQDQSQLEGRYGEFEVVLSRMADLLRSIDPDRAALLGKAFSESKKELVQVQLRELVDRIARGEFGDAVKDQKAVLDDMGRILDLLMSEDRAKRLKEKRERLEKYLQEVQKLVQRQKTLRSETERADGQNKDKAEKIGKSQGKLADDTKGLEKKIGEEDEKQKDSQPADKKESEGKQSEKENEGEKSEQGEPSPGDAEGKEGKEGKKSDSPPSPSDSSQGEPSDPSDPDEATPGRQNLKSAENAMRQAKKKLEELKNQEASKEQDKAIRELEKVIEELEEVLRQLREEERQELLANLESRLRQILDIQTSVHDGTKEIDRIPVEKRTRVDGQKAINLSRKEVSVATGLEQVLLLLNEDGSAVAFPETIEQLGRDARIVVGLLERVETGIFTQGVEEDIIDTLKELIESLQKEMQKSRQKQQEGSQGGGSGPQPLVEKIAELKMIRSLQNRVNERTDRVQKLRAEPNSITPELDASIQDLAERQHRVYEITRDIAQGKNE